MSGYGCHESMSSSESEEKEYGQTIAPEWTSDDDSEDYIHPIAG